MPVLHGGILDVLPFLESGLQEGSKKIQGKHRDLFLNVLKAILEKIFSEIDQYIRQARTAMGMEATWTEIEGGIPFSNLKTTLLVKDGEIWTDDFVMEALGLKFFSRGRYVLSKGEFDSLWHVRWGKTIEGSGLDLLDQLQTMVVPFRVSGRSNSMSVALDIPELLRLLSE